MHKDFLNGIFSFSSKGRLLGMCLYYALPHWDWGDLGKYALIGASAQLGKYTLVRFHYCLRLDILH